MKFVLWALTFLLFFSQLAHGAKKVHVLIVDSQDKEPYTSVRLALVEELKANNYIPNKNIKIKVVNAENKVGLATRLLMTELSEREYDAIVINGTVAGIAADKLGYNNSKNKFVFCSVTDPVGVGLVKKLNAPTESNFTGVAYHIPVKDRLSFLMEALPEAKKVGVIYADMPQAHSYLKWLREVKKHPKFKSLDFTYRKVAFVAGDNGHIRMAELAKEHVHDLNSKVDVYLAPSDQLGVSKEYVKLITENSKFPLMALSEKQVKESPGAHFGAYIKHKTYGAQVGQMVIRLIKGEPIGQIIPTVPSAEYGINLKQSRKINLTYPKSVMSKSVIID